MYRIDYGTQIIFDPYEPNSSILEGKLSGSKNVASYLDFTITRVHPMYNTIKERDRTVTLYMITKDGEKETLFDGIIDEIREDINGSKQISCVSSLDYLSDTLVRPYSMLSKPNTLHPPTSIDGFFDWLIDQHNSKAVESRKHFDVGLNQGASFSTSNLLYEENSSLPTTLSEINDKILSVYGGYILLRYENNSRYLDLYADIHESNAQVVDFGVNITDFTKLLSTNSMVTAVRPEGGTPKAEGTNTQDVPPITISSIPDGTTSYDEDIVKKGDIVYSLSAVQRYGYREGTYSNNNVLDKEELLRQAVIYINKMKAPIQTLTVRAVDLALYMPGYKHLQIGQAVRVRSKPHNIDEYLAVESINLDLNTPEQTSYVLGTSYDTLTGQQSGFLKSLNSSIVSAFDTAASISTNLDTLAKKVPLSETYEYASSTSKTVLPDDGWGPDMPYYVAGKYLWQRVVKQYPGDITIITDPVMITGNSSAVLKITSTNGLQFKNGIIKTSFYVSVYYGNEVVDTLTDLRLLYGETATLVWSKKSSEDSDPVVIQASDPRLANDGFQMNITADDVYTKATFYCELYS